MASETGSQLTDLLQELVSIESENPPGNEKPVAEFIIDWFETNGVESVLVEEPDSERPQVAARVGEGEPTVVLNGHIDVVPAGNEKEWTYPPFAARVDNGVLYGRGSADMKAGVAIAMLATVEFAKAFKTGECDGSIVFHAAMGEETAAPGTKTLLEMGYTGDYGIVLEPTSMRTATSEKGLAWYEITVSGEPAHASRPDNGTNAIIHAHSVLDALATYDAKVRDRKHELLGSAYATVTEFEAGTKENIVPEDAKITVDRRFLPSESATEVDSEIDALLKQVETEHDIEVTWRRTRTYESAEIPTESKIAEIVRQESARIANINPAPWGIKASTDVRNLIHDAGMEAITWGPGDLDQAHSYNERIELSEVETGFEILTSSLHELFEVEG